MNDVTWLARGRLRIADGSLEDGIADLTRFGEISDANARRNPGLWPWRSTMAETLVRMGEHDRGRELAGEELELARRVGLKALEGAPLRALALADGDIEMLERSVASTTGSALVLEHLRSQLELGTALRLRGKRERSRGPLLEALETATSIGAQPIARRAREELLASGARPRRTALRGIDALTPSEHRVASLAAQGLTNRQIAQTLYVTTKTVEAHLRNSYDKLEVGGKHELAQVFESASRDGGELAQAS
jgi:DNA-binding CsgD family transcriptional regulator